MIKFCEAVIPDMREVELYLQDSYVSGMLSNFGPNYYRLQSALHKFLNLPADKEITLVSSGHVALMAAYNLYHSADIVYPSFTFASTELAATQQDLPEIECDVNIDTGCVDISELNLVKDRMSSVCKIVAVAALSTIPDLRNLHNYCRAQNKKLIIDGASTFGTPNIYHYGDAYCLSFHATKTFPLGEGGAVITSKEDAKAIRQYINFGFNEDGITSGSGMNGKLSDYACAIGLSVLEKVPEVIARKRELRKQYKLYLNRYIPKSWSSDTIYQSLPIFLETPERAVKVRNKLRANNIECLQYYRPLNLQEYCPNSWDLYNRNICLPIHHKMTDKDVKYISELILSA